MFARTIPYNQDALVEFPCPLPEGMLPMEFVQPTLIDHTQQEQQDASAFTTHQIEGR
jgi:hypothetical protein